MALISSIASWFLKKRLHQIELFLEYPINVQNELLNNLIYQAADTEWGIKYQYSEIKSIEDYQKKVPISTYEDIVPYIDRLRKGETNLLWPDQIKWFAKSSGTTDANSKYIPVTEQSLYDCHYKGGKDLLALYFDKNPDTDLLSGKTIAVAGSTKIEGGADYFVGDLSAILMSNLPFWAHFTKSPNLSISIMEDWSKKVDLIVENTVNEDIRAISGVPSWMLVILNRVLEVTGKEKIRDVWPNFEMVAHGGVSFTPYVEQFVKIMDEKVKYQEVYNASEGFFAIQDSGDRDDLLLMLDNGVYYEFMPVSELGKINPKVVTLENVEIGENYAIIISTNAGLWRYMIGDTVVFTDNKPFRIKISGRTKSFINVVGEEMIVENADFAINHACNNTGAVVKEYTVAPLFYEDDNTVVHEWLIEFVKEPADIKYFTEIMDNAIKSRNSDYEAKRFNDIILKLPIVRSLPENSFLKWFESKGKLGGQFKVSRLSNSRDILEEIKAVIVNENISEELESLGMFNDGR